jgi:hypothetical protein
MGTSCAWNVCDEQQCSMKLNSCQISMQKLISRTFKCGVNFDAILSIKYMFPTNMAFWCHVCQTILKTILCKICSFDGYECFNFQNQTNSKYEQQLWISQFSNFGCPIGIG